ncbi:MAG: hypothetical protein KUL88_14305 [Rhizobium sp.]|nr:hypothetical protein [Rhizobium sp.]
MKRRHQANEGPAKRIVFGWQLAGKQDGGIGFDESQRLPQKEVGDFNRS